MPENAEKSRSMANKVRLRQSLRGRARPSVPTPVLDVDVRGPPRMIVVMVLVLVVIMVLMQLLERLKALRSTVPRPASNSQGPNAGRRAPAGARALHEGPRAVAEGLIPQRGLEVGAA